MTATQERREKYWKKFNEYLQKNKSRLQSKETVLPEQWHVIKLGTRVHIEVIANKKGNRVEVYFTDSKEKNKRRFSLLERDYKTLSKNKIDKDVRWEEMLNNKLSKIMVIKEHDEFEKEHTWDEQFKWLMETAQNMHDFFEPKLRELENSSIA